MSTDDNHNHTGEPRDEQVATTSAHEILRCTRGDETRIYSLRAVDGGAELWRTIETPGTQPRSLKECDFNDADGASQFLDEVRRTLKAGGWQETY